jgi:hypothetical protein
MGALRRFFSSRTFSIPTGRGPRLHSHLVCPTSRRAEFRTSISCRAIPALSWAGLHGTFSGSDRLLKTISNCVLGLNTSSTYPRGYASGVFFTLYLGSVVINHMVVRNPGCDRPLTPWSCETVEKHGRHIHILHKPEQLRGLVSPHRKDGTQNWEAGIFGPSVVACVLLSTQGYLCVLDSQDSCCGLVGRSF